jgi:hypothetical protein
MYSFSPKCHVSNCFDSNIPIRRAHTPMSPPAWIEPGTASLCLYCSTLLVRGRAGARILSRHLRHGRETVAEVALDEFSGFLCDHPDLLLTIILVSGSFLIGPDGSPRCRLIARTPALIRSSRTITRTATRTLVSGLSSVSYLTRVSNCSRVSDSPSFPSAPGVSGAIRRVLTDSSTGDSIHKFTVPAPRQRPEYSYSDKLLHFLWRSDSTFVGVDLQQTQTESKEPRTVRLGALPTNPLRIPVFLRRTGRGKGTALHLVCQLAATILRRWAKEDRTNKKTHATDGSDRTLHAGAGDHPVS